MKINPLIILGLALLSVSCNSHDARTGNTMQAAKTDTIPFTMVDTFPSGVALAPDFNRIIVEVGVNDTVLRMLGSLWIWVLCFRYGIKISECNLRPIP